MPADVVLAHYGGAPEALTLGLPVVVFAGFLLLEKRARRRERERGEQPRTGGAADQAHGTEQDGPAAD